MSNGRNLSIEEAKVMIKKFEKQETDRHVPIGDLGIGQQLDLDLIVKFLEAIRDHEQSANIDGVRIYLARSTRSGYDKEHYDVVLVPVLKNGDDLHKVYDKESLQSALPTLIGNSLPCPNVCPRHAFYC